MPRLKTFSLAVVLLLTFQAIYAFSAEIQQERLPEEKIQDHNPASEKPKTDIKTLTLDQCIELTLENNPGLQIEREKIVELENDYRIASSGLYPRLTASAYYTKLDQDRIGVLPGMAYSEETLGQLKLKQLLFDGGRIGYNSRAAAKAAEAQRESAEAARLDTVYAVSQAYYRLLEARELLRVGENSRSQREAFLKLTDSYHKAGKATRLETLRAEAQLLDAERTLIQAGEAMRISELILKKTMGIGVQALIDIADGLPDAFAEPGQEEILFTQVLENNPDLKRSAQFKEQARLSIDSAAGSYLPELSLQASYGYRDRGAGSAGEEWTAGVFLEWSLFEGGLTRGAGWKGAGPIPADRVERTRGAGPGTGGF